MIDMRRGRALITGGLGFIGFNALRHYAARGWDVVALDNLSRGSARKNLRELRARPVRGAAFVEGDVKDAGSIKRLFRRKRFDLVLHLAGQVAVTSSIADPVRDFQDNAWGTLSVLEAARRFSPRAAFVYASTNKVYGGLERRPLIKGPTRYRFGMDAAVSEGQPLDFHSPYACSKGAADQYVRDYARLYGLWTVVFRQSCIYGPWQYGEEDQGWIAWFLIAALSGRPLTLYGDGRQVRDALYVDDLLALYDAALERPRRSAGQVFNAGGGSRNTLSLLELVSWIRGRLGVRPRLARRASRAGDQKVFVSDISRARAALGWRPRVPVGEGLERLLEWLRARR